MVQGAATTGNSGELQEYLLLRTKWDAVCVKPLYDRHDAPISVGTEKEKADEVQRLCLQATSDCSGFRKI